MAYIGLQGQTLSLTAGSLLQTNTVTNVEYQWRCNGVDLPNATSNTYVKSNLSKNEMGYYDVFVKNKIGGNGIYSNSELILVYGAPLINIQPVSVYAKEGESILVTANTIGVEPLTYEWYKDNQKLNDQNLDRLNIEKFSSSNTGVYFYKVYSQNNNLFVTQSNNFNLNLYQKPQIVTHPYKLSPISNPLKNETFKISAVAISSTSVLNYKWRKNGIFLEDKISKIKGSSTANLEISTAIYDDTATYDVVVSNEYGSTISNSIYIQVNTIPVIISPQSLNNTIVYKKYYGDDVVFTVNVLSSTQTSYKWFFKQEDTNTYIELNDEIYNSLFLSNLTSKSGGQYKVEVTNSYGSSFFIFQIDLLNLPVIEFEPQDQTVFLSYPANFDILVRSTSKLKYEWFFQSLNSTKFNLLQSGYNSKLTIPSIDTNSFGYYKVIATNKNGSVSSRVASLKLLQRSPKFISYPNLNNYTIYQKDPVTLKYEIEVHYDELINFYFKDIEVFNIKVLSGSDIAINKTTINSNYKINNKIVFDYLTVEYFGNLISITINSFQNFNAGKYTIKLSNSFDSISDTRELLYDDGVPKLLSTNNFIFGKNNYAKNSNQILSVQVGGPNIAYSWQKFSTNWSEINSTNELSLQNLSTSNIANYRVSYTNEFGSSTGNFSINVFEKVFINKQPESKIIVSGETGILDVQAEGALPLSYQWMFNGTNLTSNTLYYSGFNERQLYIKNAKSELEGLYSVKVSNENSYENSIAAKIYVKNDPPKFCSFSNLFITKYWGESFDISGDYEGSLPITNQWYFSNESLSSLVKVTNQTQKYYTLTNIDNNSVGYYTMSATNKFGTTYSNIANQYNPIAYWTYLDVNPNLYLKDSPKSAFGVSSLSLSIPVEVYGSGLSFQWYKDKNAITTQKNKALTFNSLQKTDAGQYYLKSSQIINGNTVYIDTPPFTLSVIDKLLITNSTLNLSATITNTGLVRYSPFSLNINTSYDATIKPNNSGVIWYKSGKNDSNFLQISNETGLSFLIPGVTTGDIGRYRAKLINPLYTGDFEYSKTFYLTGVCTLALSKDIAVYSGNSNSNILIEQLTNNAETAIQYGYGQFMLSGVVDGDEPLTYKWKSGEKLTALIDISNATGIIYTGNSKVNKSAFYSLDVTNKYNTSTYSEYLNIVIPAKITGLNLVKKYGGTILNKILITDEQKLNDINYQIKLSDYFNTEAGYNRCYEITALFDGNPNEAKFRKETDNISFNVQPITNTTNLTSKFNTNLSYNNIIYNYITNSICFANASIQQAGVYCMYGLNRFTSTTGKINIDFFNSSPEIINCAYFLEKNQTAPAAGFSYKLISSTLDQTDKLISSTSANSNNALSWNTTSNTIISALPKDALMVPKGVLSNKDKDYYMFLENSNSYLEIAATGSGDENYRVEWFLNDVDIKTATTTNSISNISIANLNISTTGKNYSSLLSISNFQTSNVGIYSAKISSNNYSTSTIKYFEIKIAKKPQITNNTVLYQYDQTGLKIISPSLTGYIKESGTLYAEISAIGTPTLKSPPVAGMMGVYGVNWSLKKVTGISGGKNLYSDYVFGVENRSTSNAAGHTNKYVFTASTGMNGLYYPVISTDYGSDTGNAFCVAVIDYPEVLCWRATQASIAAAATDPRVSSTYNISDATYNSNFNPQVIQAGSGFYLSIITNPPLITQSANNAIMPLIYSYMFSGTGGISTFRYTGTNNSNYDIFRREMSIENSGLYKMKITPSGNYNNAFTGVETNWLSLGVDYKIESQFSNIVHDCFVYNTGTKTYVNKTTKDANGNLNYLNPSKIILNEGECVYLSGCVLPTTIPTAYPQVYKWLFYPKDGFRINIPVYPYPIKSPYTTGVSGKITSTGFATTLPELKRCVDFTGSGLNGFGFYGRDIGIYQLYSEQYYPDRKKLLCTKFFEPICIDVLTKPSGYAFIGGTGPYSNFYPGTFFEEYSRTGIYIGENISGSFYFGATDCASTKDITIDIFTGNPYVSFTGNDNIKISGQTSLQYSEYEKNLQDSAVREPKIVRINYSGLKFGQDPIVFTPYFTTDKKVSLYGKNFTILVTGSVFISKQVDSTMDLYEKQSGSQYINASGSPVLTYQWWKSGKTNSLVTTNTEIDGVSTNKINFKSPSLSATGIYFPVVTQTFKNINNGYVYTGIVTGSSLKLNVIPQGPKFIYNSTTFKTGTFWASTGEKFLISGSGSGFSPFQYQFFKNQAQYKNISGTEQDKQISGYSGFGWSKIIETGDTACWEFSIKNQNYINNVDLNACYRTGMCLKVMATPNIIYTSNNYYVPSGYAAEIIIKTTFEAINEPSIYYKWFKSGSGNNFIQLTNTSGTTFKISGYSGVSGSGSKVLSSGSNFYIRIPSEENSKSVYPNNYFGTYKISGSGVYDSTNPKTVFNFEKTFNVLTNAATTGQPVWAGGKSGETSLIWFGYGNNYFSGNLNSGIYKVYLWGAGGGASELSLSDSDGGTSYWNGGSNGASFSGCYNLITGKYFELSIGQGGLANWTDLATRRGAIAGEQRNPAAKGANGIAGISGPTISSPNEAPTVTTGTITQITGIAANSPYQQLVLSSKAGKLPIDTGIKVAGGGGGGGTSFGLWVQSTGTGTKVMERFINVPGGGGAGAASKYMANQRDWIIGSVGGGVDKIDAQKGGGRRYIQNTVNSTGKYFHGGDGSFSANGGGGASAYLYDYAGDGGVGGAFSCYYSLLQSGATSYTGNCYSGTSVNYAYSLTQSKLYPSLAASIDPLNIVNEVYSIFSECWPGKGSVEQDGHHGAFVIVKLS